MNQPLKALLVGCGSISDLWLGPAKKLPNVELVGLVDLAEENAKAQAEKHGLDVSTGTDLQSALDALEPDIVFNCTVPAAHFEVTKTSLRRGCHVFSEKPMADTMSEAREMLRVAAETGRAFAVMQNRRYDPNIRALASFLQGGVIGDVTTVDADFYIGAHFGGFREEMAHVLVKDMAIHTFDSARLLTNQNAKSVYCYEWNPANSWYERDASAVAIFEMTGDVVFTYRGSWCAEGLRTPWESAWRVVGTKGSVTWDGATGLRCEVVETPEGFIYPYREVEVPELRATEMTAWHGSAVEAFVGAVRRGETPETTGADNIRSLAMVYGAVESSEAGRRVAVDLDAKETV